jgi:hypothetical protein
VAAVRRRGPRRLTSLRVGAPSLVPSLVLTDTTEHGPASSGLSSLLSGNFRHATELAGRLDQTTQIYEGTNQIQRMVIAKRLLG